MEDEDEGEVGSQGQGSKHDGPDEPAGDGGAAACGTAHSDRQFPSSNHLGSASVKDKQRPRALTTANGVGGEQKAKQAFLEDADVDVVPLEGPRGKVKQPGPPPTPQQQQQVLGHTATTDGVSLQAGCNRHSSLVASLHDLHKHVCKVAHKPSHTCVDFQAVGAGTMTKINKDLGSLLL